MHVYLHIHPDEPILFLRFAQPFLAPIPEAAQYQLVYDLDIPVKPKYNSAGPAYNVNQDPGAFSRIAYYLELDDSYVWVSMGRFSSNYNEIGVPCVNAEACPRTTLQKTLTNVNVQSSLPGLDTNGANGNMEFWHWDYSRNNNMGIPGASGDAYDFGDRPNNRGSYGSMQIHLSNNAAGIYEGTVFAFNNFNNRVSGNADIGIGNRPSGNPDWTNAYNAGTYTTRKIQVFVMPVVRLFTLENGLYSLELLL